MENKTFNTYLGMHCPYCFEELKSKWILADEGRFCNYNCANSYREFESYKKLFATTKETFLSSKGKE